MEFPITFLSFLKGRRTRPIRGSFWASRGLNPFLDKNVLDSKFFLKNEENSGVLTNLTNVDNFIKRLTTRYAKSGKYIYKESSGSWTLDHTDANTNTVTNVLEMLIEPHAKNLHWFSNTKVGKYDGGWTDSWKTGLTTGDHYGLTIRDWSLISNGQYIAGWKEADGSDFDLALLDLQPGYLSKRLLMRKAYGIRQALIMAIYPTDRTKDGIFIWNPGDDAPVDFISVPWLHDFWIENNVIYVIHGNSLDISAVLIGTMQLQYLNSVLDQPVIGAVNVTAKFLGKWANLILIGANGQRWPAKNGDTFYPGLWAYNVEKNSLFYWLPPSSGDFDDVDVSAVLVDQQDLWVASNRYNNSAFKYFIDKLTKITDESSGTFRQMLIGPILDAGSINDKEWKKIKLGHNKLLTGSEIRVKHRDFTRDLNSIKGIVASNVTNITFTLAATYGKVGDEVVVSGGPGAGQIRHITKIDASHKYTLDRAWDSNPVATQSTFEINSWIHTDKHTPANSKFHGRFMTFMSKDIDYQFKLAFKHGKAQTIRLKGIKVKGNLLPDE